jgi:lactate racemase
MSISHYSYKYGHGSKEFSLESDRVIKEVTVAKMPLLEDVKAAILDAVYHPIGSAPINELVKPGQKIAFICNDPTRVANSFVFMPILVNEMNKLGIKDEDMHIVFALGTHRNMTHEEMVEAVGADVAGRLKMYISCRKQWIMPGVLCVKAG